MYISKFVNNKLIKMFSTKKAKLLNHNLLNYELELAFFELLHLTGKSYISRLAYFKSINNQITDHCFSYSYNNKFDTYGVHNLYPFKGKTPPQLIKAILNVNCVQSRDIVLDPFCGSGTTTIESSILGMNSIGIDVSEFACFISKAKYNALFLNQDLIKNLYLKAKFFIKYFYDTNFQIMIDEKTDPYQYKLYQLSLLAFADALGLFHRSNNRNISLDSCYERILYNYEQKLKNFYIHSNTLLDNIGYMNIIHTTSLSIPLTDNCVDCIITSPPYFNIIDYPRMDEIQLRTLYHYDFQDLFDLRELTTGLRGNRDQLFTNYLIDMRIILYEIIRVLKPSKTLTLIIGSNIMNEIHQLCLSTKLLEFIIIIQKSIISLNHALDCEYILIYRKIE